MKSEHEHFNRIKKIIKKSNNGYDNLKSIKNIIDNYKVVFGATKLHSRLVKAHKNLKNDIKN